MGTVSYRARFTRNMGNFESLQLEIGVEDEPRGDEKFAEAYNRVKDCVESRLFDDVEELEASLVNVRKKVVADAAAKANN
jgi:hypothetical protein